MKHKCSSVSMLGVARTPVVDSEGAFFCSRAKSGFSTVNQGERYGPQYSFAFASGAFSTGTCGVEWWVWLLVISALLSAVLWSKETLENLQSYYAIRRLYGLAGLGVAILAILFFMNGSAYIVPIGIGTVALVIAGVVDLLRREVVPAHVRLIRTMYALMGTLVIAIAFALFFDRSCLYAPLVVAIAVIAVRYAIFRVNLTQEEE